MNNRFYGLNKKTAAVIIFAALVGVGIFFLSCYAVECYIDNIYLSDESYLKRGTHFANEFNNYVSKNNISSRDIITNGTVDDIGDYVYFYIIDGDSLSGDYALGSASPKEDPESTYPTDASETYKSQYYNISYSDGVYKTAVIDLSSSFILRAGYSLALALAFSTALLITLLWIGKLTKRISDLSEEVDNVAQGDIDASIITKGNDEIAALAVNTEMMRQSLTRLIEDEKIARNANSELIASMSHDLRTPLTSLIGYLDLANEKLNYNLDATKKYLDEACAKALQLKSLSDKMFGYFSVYATKELAMDKNEYDCEILFSQLIGEHTAYMESLGFTAEFKNALPHTSFSTDIDMLKRIFDNIYSNAGKYALPSSGVYSNAQQIDNKIIIEVTNEKNPDADKRAGTNIGLKTCKKLAESLGGSFTVSAKDNHFKVTLKLPLS